MYCQLFPPSCFSYIKPWCLILLVVQQLCPNRSKLAVRRKEVTMQSMFSSLNQVPGLGWSGPKSFSVHGSKLFVNKSKNSGLQFPESAFLTFRGVNLCWQSRQLSSVSFLWHSGNCKLGFQGNISKPTTDISFTSFFRFSEVCALQMEVILINF